MSSRKRRRVRLGRTFGAVSLALAGLVLSAVFVGITVQGNALAREIASYRSDIRADEATQASLTSQIERQNTADYVREKARDYGYIGPNESLIEVQRDGQATDVLSRTVSEGPSRIARWFAFFFGSR